MRLLPTITLLFRILEEKEGDFREKVRVLEVLGDIKGLVGDYDACLKYWNEALQLWERLGEKEKVARLFRKTAYVLWVKTGDTEKAKEYHAKALEILEAQPESIELASLYADIAEMYWHSGEMDKAAAFIDKAIKLAKKLNAYEILANSYIVLAKIVSMKNRKEASEYSEEALRIALNHRYIKTAVEAYANCASPHFGAESGERRLQMC